MSVNSGSRVPPNPSEYWARKYKRLEERIRALETAPVGNAMTVDGAPGIVVSGGGQIALQDGGGLTVDDGGNITLNGGDLTLNGGDLIVDDGVARSGNFVHGSSGWRLQPGGNAEFNDITLLGGIIGDDALANPIRGKVGHASAAGFSVGTTIDAKATATVTVPSGFSSALVIATMTATVINGSASVGYFQGYAEINDTPPSGWDAAVDVDPGYAGHIAHTTTSVLNSLSGSFHVRGWLQSSAGGWGSDGFNNLNVDALIMFLR